MNWRQRLGAFIGGFDAGQHHRRLRGFQATRAHVNALIAASGPDITARARWLVRNNGYAVNAVESWAANTVGDGIKPILLGALVGAPAYLNGYAAVPLVEALLAQGMSQGAAMSFVIAGGVSCIPAAIAVWALVKPRVFAAYLGFAVTGAVIAGVIWQAAS